MRRKTLSVKIGKVFIGSDHSIKTQSMTTASTMDTDQSVDEAIRIIEAGGKLVRFTAPNINEAKNLINIKNALVAKGYDDPLVADIHFTPNAALEASKIVEKVRINPGNYVDKKKFEVKEYDDESYQDELLKIEKKFIPLINSCKENGVAMRIGTNHGSLSDRVMNRFGDTPLGMVESAMEFLRICKQNDYDQIVLSMKSSNPIVMIHAYRLLVKSMENENMHYPLHLGVTEAGDGLDGRIKSALGIGTLLTEGIGDTIRVSLSSDPVDEIKAGFEILKSLGIRARGVNIISCPSCARQAFPVIETVKILEEKLSHIKKPINLSIIGCVVNGPGEAAQTEIGLTGGGQDNNLLYLSGIPHTKVPSSEIIDKVVKLVEEKTKD